MNLGIESAYGFQIEWIVHLLDGLLLRDDRVLEVPHFNSFALAVLCQVVPKLLYLVEKYMAPGQ